MKFRLIPEMLICSVFLTSCANTGAVNSETLPFQSKPKSVNVSPGMIDESSGIAQSSMAGNFLWVEQDSGNPTEIYRLGTDGVLISKVTIKGITNRDWEDLVISKGPVPGTDYIYLAETGDNFSKHDFYQIYRFPEPTLRQDTVALPDKIVFRYEDGSHDAEAILVDHISKDIYVITKRDAKSMIFRLSYPQSLTETNVAVKVGEFPFNGVVSAGMSTNSKEILIKTYTAIYYWNKGAGETIESTLKKSGEKLGYSLEPQGEAICFSYDGSGFFTLSEKPLTSSSVDLHFYARK